MHEVLVSADALHMLIAAGKAVLAASTRDGLGGGSGAGSAHAQALRNAIGLAEIALTAAGQPREGQP